MMLLLPGTPPHDNDSGIKPDRDDDHDGDTTASIAKELHSRDNHPSFVRQ